MVLKILRMTFIGLVLYGVICVNSFASIPGEIRVGILAHRGIEKTQKLWQPTLDYLHAEFPSYQFRLIPLTNDDIERVVEQGQIEFLLTNPASYVYLEAKHGLSRVATLRKRDKKASYTVFGSVIFTRADKKNINSLKDVVGKSYMGIHPNGFGGWWMALREFKQLGINPESEFANLSFSGFPQSKVVDAVLNGVADVGNVRTGILESLSKAGKLDLNDIKILNEQRSVFFSVRHSTKLYPEWPFAVLRHVPYELTQKVALALFSMESQHPAAVSAGIAGWTIPLDYKPVHDLMRELKVGHYKESDNIRFADVLAKYWRWAVGMIVIMSALGTLVFIFSQLNRRLSSSNRLLQREIYERELLQEKLRYQALHDSLTELPNRVFFNDCINKAIGEQRSRERHFAVAIIDLDHFKEVNDSLGHQAGDKLLQLVAKRLFDAVRENDVIARLGGDEFAIIMETEQKEDSIDLANEILKEINAPLLIEGRQLYIGASMGIALYPNHGKDVEVLIRNADVAMYQAKRSGLSVMVYDTKLDKDSSEAKLIYKSNIREAFLEDEAFEVYYQPRISASTSQVSGLESLVRWHHPDRGIVYPKDFIHVIEDIGLMERLTLTVLDKVIRDAQEWQTSNNDFSISLNLSSSALIIPSLAEKLLRQIEKSEFAPSKLEIEIGINSNLDHIYDDLERAVKLLERQGLVISIDNFGENSFSFNNIQTLPVKGIKLDRNFVKDSAFHGEKREMVGATVAMAHRLGYWVTAAGVENEEVWQTLKKLDCDYGQGFYFTKPLSRKDIILWLENADWSTSLPLNQLIRR